MIKRLELLIPPSNAIQDAEQRRQARLLSLMILALVGLTWMVELFSYLLYNRPGDPYTGYRFTLLSMLALLFAFVLSRTRHYQLAADLTVIITLVTLVDIVYFTDATPNLTLFDFCIIPILMSSLFFTPRKATLWNIAILGLVLASAWLIDPASLQPVAEGPFVLLLAFSLMGMLMMAHRQSLEREHQKYLSEQVLLRTKEQAETNRLLTQSVQELEQTGAELREQLELEKIVADLSAHFIHMPLEEIDAGIERCLQVISEYTGAERSFVLLNQPDGKTMTNTHEWCAPDVPSRKRHLQRLPLSSFPVWAGQLARLENVHVAQVEAISPEAASEQTMLRQQGLQSVLIFPLARGSKVFGCLGFASANHQRAWREHEILQVKTVAEMVANTLSHQKAEQALQRKDAQQKQLIAFARQLSSTLSVEAMWQMIEAAQGSLFPQDQGCFFDAAAVVRPTPPGASAPGEETPGLFSPEFLAQAVAGAAAQNRCLVVSPAAEAAGGTAGEAAGGEHLVIPFFSGEELLGGVCLARSEDVFTSDDLQLAETFAALASAALKNATTHAWLLHAMDERTHAERLQLALYHISEASYATRSLDELFQCIHKIVAGLIPAQNFYVALYDESDEMVSFPYFVDEKDLPPEPHHLENSLTDHVIRSGAPLTIAPAESQRLLDELGVLVLGAQVSHWLGVPLKISSGKILGMLAVQQYNLEPGCQYTLREQEILAFVSSQVAMAIDRLNVQSALAASEARFRAISDMTSDFAYALQVQPGGAYAMIWITDAVSRITGFTPQEMLAWQSSSISDLVHPEDRQEFQKIEQAWRANQSFTNTFRIVTKNLETRHIRHIANPVWSSAEQRVTAVIGAVQDITQQVWAAEQVELAHTELELRVQERTAELKEANQTLRAEIAERRLTQQFLQESEERYRSVSETAKDGIVTINKNMEIVAWNKGAEKIFGYSLDEIIGQPLEVIVPAGKLDRHRSAIASNERSGFVYDSNLTLEASGRRKNGEIFPAELNFSSWTTRDGVFMTSFVRDVSSRKAAEDALHRVYNENRQLLSAIKSILVVVNAQGLVSYWNETAAAVFGLEAEQTVGKRLDELEIGWDCATLLEKIDECKLSQQNLRLDDLYIKFANRENRIIGFTVTPLTDINSGDRGALLLGSDITHRRSLEQQLAQAQKLEALGQLAAGIAHEINTPTQFVNSNLVFLDAQFGVLKKIIGLQSELKAKLRASVQLSPDLALRIRTQVSQSELDYILCEFPRAMQQSLEGTQRIAHIVQAMREFSHPGGDHKTPTDLNHALQSTVEVTRSAWKHIADLEMCLAPGLPLVACLPAELNQCFLNILINAVDAIRDVVGDDPPEKGKITIQTRLNEPWVEIRISDTGKGIPPEIIDRIFDPFFTTKEIGKGTGQGLTISRNIIVKKHQGQITCQSRPGLGATFIIRLPLRENVAAVAPAAAAEPAVLAAD